MALNDDFGGTTLLRDVYDECLGRIGKQGTLFVDFVYFAKNTPKGRKVELLTVSEGDVCEILDSSGPGGFSSLQIGRFVYVP